MTGWRRDTYECVRGQVGGSCGLAADGFTAKEGGVYYSKLNKSMIVILISICVKV